MLRERFHKGGEGGTSRCPPEPSPRVLYSSYLILLLLFSFFSYRGVVGGIFLHMGRGREIRDKA
jgi:hypothetical protein